MGLFDFLKKKKGMPAKVERVVLDSNKSKTVNAQDDDYDITAPFIADISLYEFENVNWSEFGGILKQKRILPNSYNKNPENVEVKPAKNGKPMVVLTFNSETSDSVRTYMLLQDGVFQYVNGVVSSENEALNLVWKDFKEEIRYRTFLETNREGRFQKDDAERLMKKAEKKMGLDNLYQEEQVFLKKYKDAKFDDFCHTYLHLDYGITDTNYVPAFIPLLDKPQNGRYTGEPVLPFSPRTLEFCILHMTEEEKAAHGEYVNDFENMCKKIQKLSCFESEDWDKVIAIGKDIVKKQYQASVVTNESI